VPTKLQNAVASCESFLRDHPDATVAEAIAVLWDSFGLERNDVLPYKQIWFPDDLQEKIQHTIIRRVWVAAFTEASELVENLSRSRR
jgi:hypothetical protein